MKTLLNRVIGSLILIVFFPLGAHVPRSALNDSGHEARPPIRSAINQVVQASVTEVYGKLPLSFEANQGQSDALVKFLSRGRGYTLFLTPTEAIMVFKRLHHTKEPDPRSSFQDQIRSTMTETLAEMVLRIQFVGANPVAQMVGVDELTGKSNYFIGNDPEKWRTNVPTYAKVKYQDIYPRVDLIFYGNQGQLEFDFIVRPGADLGGITLAFQGSDQLEVDAQGDLILHTIAGQIRQRKPFVYQELDDHTKREISSRYVLKGQDQVGFEVVAYDNTRALVIDPVLSYSTYLGGSDTDGPSEIVLDSLGNLYLTGGTTSSDFPTANPFQPNLDRMSLSGAGDAFITKLDPSGALIYSTYFGGSGSENATGLAVDTSDNLYITGRTSSADLPVLNPFQATAESSQDSFVAKFNSTGSALIYSTYLGGTADDQGQDIAVDLAGSAYVTGWTASPDFPTSEAVLQASCGSGPLTARVLFVTKLDPQGSQLVYSTCLGGSNNEEVFSITVDSSGSAYVTGITRSSDFPTTIGAFQRSCVSLLGPCFDAFVAKLDPAGSTLVYSTYLGGSDVDGARSIVVDSAGNAYIIGSTRSTDFPTANAFQANLRGSADSFVTKLNSTGSELVFSTYLGGSGSDSGFGIALDAGSNVYITGGTSSTDFPITNPVQETKAAGSDVFVAKLHHTGSDLIYSTYLGGDDDEGGVTVVVDANGSSYVAGVTFSSDFPTLNPLQPTFGGFFDAFVAKIGGDQTVLVANFMNGNNDAFNSRVYLWNPSQSPGDVTVRVFTLSLIGGGGLAQELTVAPLNLGTLGARSALNIKLAEDILTPLGMPLPYTDDGGNLTLEFTIEADNVRGATQVFSSSLAFGTNPLQEIPSTSSGSPTVLVANFMNGNDAALNSRVYLWNSSTSAGAVTVRVFTLPLSSSTAQELTGAPLDLGLLGAKSALSIKVADDILTPLGITTPYTIDGGNLTLEFTIQAADVVGAAQVFSSSFAFGTNPLQVIPSTSSGSPTVLVANFTNGNDAALDSRVYLWNPSTSAGAVTVRVFTLPLAGGMAQELTVEPLVLGPMGAKSALNLKLAEDILTPLEITTPYTTDGGNLTLEFTIEAANVRGAAQVFSSSFAFGTYPLQVIPSTSSESPTVLVANFTNGNNDAFNSRVYLWNPSQSAGNVTVRVFTLPLAGGMAQELTVEPFSLGSLEGKSARNIKLVEDILTPLGISTPYTTDGGNLTLEFTIQAADVRGAVQVFSDSFAFGTYPLQVLP